MKQRMSLVSNSSSSSFIVVFPRKPQLKEEVLEWMFNGVDKKFPYKYDSDFSMSTKEISEVVFNDCKDKNKATKEELIREFLIMVHLDMLDLEKNDKDDNPLKMIACMEMFGFENSELIKELIENKQKITEIEAEIDIERNNLMTQFNIHGCLTGKEPEEFKKQDTEILQKRWKMGKPIHSRSAEILRIFAEQRTDKFIEDNKEWWYTILNYEDHSKQGSFMEHNNVFRHIQHIQISHH